MQWSITQPLHSMQLPFPMLMATTSPSMFGNARIPAIGIPVTNDSVSSTTAVLPTNSAATNVAAFSGTRHVLSPGNLCGQPHQLTPQLSNFPSLAHFPEASLGFVPFSAGATGLWPLSAGATGLWPHPAGFSSPSTNQVTPCPFTVPLPPPLWAKSEHMGGL
jgi:hypothetical protein